MNENVNQLSVTVQTLRTAGHPAHAVILDALAALPMERLTAIIEHRTLVENDVRLAIDVTGHHPLAVRDVLSKFVQFDCRDYRAKYVQLLTECRSAHTNNVP